MRRVKRTLIACAASLAALGGAAPAGAATLTLTVPSKPTTFGHGALLSGVLRPAAAGQRVLLKGAIGGGQRTLAIARTNAAGAWHVRLRARRPLWLTARWKGGSDSAVSPRRRLLLRPRVRLTSSSATAFGAVQVTGSVAPVRRGRHIQVLVTRRGHVLARRSVVLQRGRSFAVALPTAGSGRYVVQARYTGDHL